MEPSLPPLYEYRAYYLKYHLIQYPPLQGSPLQAIQLHFHRVYLNNKMSYEHKT